MTKLPIDDRHFGQQQEFLRKNDWQAMNEKLFGFPGVRMAMYKADNHSKVRAASPPLTRENDGETVHPS